MGKYPSTDLEDFPIVDDPSDQWSEQEGPPYEGLYGKETMQRALSIDFDGVLHQFSDGWKGHDNIYDKPVEGSVEACYSLVEAGWKLYVLTSRAHLKPVAQWLAKHGFPPMILTRIKPISVAFIDDRAVRFTNWNDIRKLFA